jgi:hypothetical protein
MIVQQWWQKMLSFASSKCTSARRGTSRTASKRSGPDRMILGRAGIRLAIS